MYANVLRNGQVVVYTRQAGNDKGLECGNSQFELCSSYAQRRGLGDSITVYEDKASRNMLQKLIADVQDGNIGCVVVDKLERMFRSLDELMNLLTVFSENDVRLVAITSGIDTGTEASKLQLEMLKRYSDYVYTHKDCKRS